MTNDYDDVYIGFYYGASEASLVSGDIINAGASIH